MRAKIVYGAKGPEYWVDGKRVSRAAYDKAFPDRTFEAPRVVGNHAGWPRYSNNFGVHPSQIKQQTEAYRKLGMNVEFRPDGKMKIASQRQQRALVKLLNKTTFARTKIADFDDIV